MSVSEKTAYEYLILIGYSYNEITFQPRRLPDFITADNVEWEVKTTNYLQSSNGFSNEAQRLDYDAIILIVDENTKTIRAVPFYEILMELSEKRRAWTYRIITYWNRETKKFNNIMGFAEPINKFKSKKQMKAHQKRYAGAWEKVNRCPAFTGGW